MAGWEKCTVAGKDCYPTKDLAKAAAQVLRSKKHGRGGTYRCPFGDHYHTTKGLRGQKGKDLR